VKTGDLEQPDAAVVVKGNASYPWMLRVPNTAFAITLGLGGNAILWKNMAVVDFTSDVGTTGNWLFWISAIVALGLACIVYLVKLIIPSWRVLVLMEWNDPVRAYFFVAPVVAILMLTLSIPTSIEDQEAERTLFLIALTLQVVLAQSLYTRWMYSCDAHLGKVGAPVLLSVVSWFLLTVLGNKCKLQADWGLPLPAMCFGTGCAFLLLSVVAIFQGTHSGNTVKGHPSLFLLIAPPAVASLGLEGFEGTYGDVSSAIFGYCLMLLIVLLGLSPTILKPPELFGAYWAYVFPMAALATCSIKMAKTHDSYEAKVLAWACIALATFALFVVFCRMSWHQVGVMQGLHLWEDPLFDKYAKKSKSTDPIDAGKHRFTDDVSGCSTMNEQVTSGEGNIGTSL